MSTFKPNQNVVCINPFKGLVQYKIYTIKAIHYCNCKKDNEFLELEEFSNTEPFNVLDFRCGKIFNATNLNQSNRFRPLIPNHDKANISDVNITIIEETKESITIKECQTN